MNLTKIKNLVRENNVLVDTLNTNKRIQKIDLQLYKDINNLFSLGSIRSGYRKNPHI